MTEMHKRVADVTAVALADETTADLLTGATVIPLANSGDFELGDAPSGLVIIDGDVYAYSAVEEGEDDDTPEPSITLDTGLLGDIPEGTIVAVWDAGANGGTGAVAVDYMVDVTDDLDGSPGQAYLHYTLIPSLPEGLPPDVGDSVTVRIDDNDDWWVVNVHGRRATVDPGHIRTGTLQADVSVTVGTPGGKRVVIDGSPAIELYNAANEQTGNLDGEENFLQGSIATDASDQPRVEVGAGETGGFPPQEVRFYSSNAEEINPGDIVVSIDHSGPPGSETYWGQLEVTAPRFNASEDPPTLALISASDDGSQSGSARLTGPLILLDGAGANLQLSTNALITGGNLHATMGVGDVGTGTFRDSVRAAIGPAWTSYAGSITTANVTVGNGTLAADYLQNGKLVHFIIKLTFGSTTALTGSPTFTLPVSAKANRIVVGGALMFDSSVAIGSAYKGGWVFNNTINVLQVRDPTSAPLSATVPFTWATGDELVLEGYYQAA